MNEIVVFGDTGGHSKQLFASLEEVGVNLEDFTIPEGLTIVHLGDLIHRGPDSNILVSVVNSLISNNPGQWIQIVGNHESQHILGGLYFWKCDCTSDTLQTIREWWDKGAVRVALALEVDGNHKTGLSKWVLATHGGLTYPIWKNTGEMQDCISVAKVLNENAKWALRSAGEAIGYERHGVVGPIWARVNEVYNYWNEANAEKSVSMPFNQLIGHTAPYSFDNKAWYATSSLKLRSNATVDMDNLRTVVQTAGKTLVCMDPNYGYRLDDADHLMQPFLKLDGKTY